MRAGWRRLLIWSVIGLCLAAGLFYAFRAQTVPVDIVTATRGAMLETLDEDGVTRIRDVFVLSAPIAGRALRIDADVGDIVVAGETLLARIEPSDPSFLDARPFPLRNVRPPACLTASRRIWQEPEPSSIGCPCSSLHKIQPCLPPVHW